MTSPSFRYFVVGTTANAGQPGVDLVRLDLATGQMAVVASNSEIDRPSFVDQPPRPVGEAQISKLSGVFYAVSEAKPGQVYALQAQRNAVGSEDRWRIVALNRQLTGGDEPCHVGFDRSGRWLAVSHWEGGVSVFGIESDGSIGERVGFFEYEPRDRFAPSPDQGQSRMHCVAFSPRNRIAAQVDLGNDRIYVHHFDPKTGGMQYATTITTPDGTGPRHAVFFGEDLLVVVNEVNGSVETWRNPLNGPTEPENRLDLRDFLVRQKGGVDVSHCYPSDLCFTSRGGRALLHVTLRHRQVAEANAVVSLELDALGRFLDDNGSFFTAPVVTPTGAIFPRTVDFSGDWALFPSLDGHAVTALHVGPDGQPDEGRTNLDMGELGVTSVHAFVR